MPTPTMGSMEAILKVPFQSEKQRRFLWKNEPELAKKWARKYGSKAIRKEALNKMITRVKNGSSNNSR
jgi:predicted amidophosphoribosyltransferase